MSVLNEWPPSTGEAGAPVSPVGRMRSAIQKVNWKYPIFGLTAVILLWLVAAPLVMVVWAAFTEARPGSPDFFAVSGASLRNWYDAISSPATIAAVRNTGIFTVATTTFAVAIGAYLAWVVERTNTPWRSLITLFCVLRLIVPGLLVTISWIFLASPDIGMLNEWLPFGGSAPFFDIYSMFGLIWVETMDVFPVAFLLIAAALRSIDPSFEEASTISGAGRWRTTMLVTFPVILPATLAATILVFIRGIETFEAPALIGVPAGIYTFAIEIYLNTSSTPTDTGLAAVYAVMMLALTIILLWFYQRVAGKSEMFATISGKGFRPARIDLGRLKWLTFGSASLIMFLSLGLPLIVLLWASLTTGSFEPISLDGLSSLTLANYATVFESDLAMRAFLNSTALAVGSATAVVLLMSIVAWITVKTRLPGRKWLDYLAFAPIAIPSAMMGIAFLWLYLTLPLPIYGTLWIMFLLYIAKYAAVTMRVMAASTTQVNDELVEAAEVCGRSWFGAFRTVVVPLLKPGMLAAWIFAMIHAFRELAASVFVYSSGNEPVGVAIFSMWHGGDYGVLSAFGILILLGLCVISLVAMLLSKRFGVRDSA